VAWDDVDLNTVVDDEGFASVTRFVMPCVDAPCSMTENEANKNAGCTAALAALGAQRIELTGFTCSLVCGESDCSVGQNRGRHRRETMPSSTLTFLVLGSRQTTPVQSTTISAAIENGGTVPRSFTSENSQTKDLQYGLSDDADVQKWISPADAANLFDTPPIDHNDDGIEHRFIEEDDAPVGKGKNGKKAKKAKIGKDDSRAPAPPPPAQLVHLPASVDVDRDGSGSNDNNRNGGDQVEIGKAKQGKHNTNAKSGKSREQKSGKLAAVKPDQSFRVDRTEHFARWTVAVFIVAALGIMISRYVKQTATILFDEKLPGEADALLQFSNGHADGVLRVITTDGYAEEAGALLGGVPQTQFSNRHADTIFRVLTAGYTEEALQ